MMAVIPALVFLICFFIQSFSLGLVGGFISLASTLILQHSHLGSQVPDIIEIRKYTQEACRFFVEISNIGAPLKYIDLGGGLGVDYTGENKSKFHSITSITDVGATHPHRMKIIKNNNQHTILFSVKYCITFIFWAFSHYIFHHMVSAMPICFVFIFYRFVFFCFVYLLFFSLICI